MKYVIFCLLFFQQLAQAQIPLSSNGIYVGVDSSLLLNPNEISVGTGTTILSTKLRIYGGLSLPIRTVTASETVTVGDFVIAAANGATTVNITLPDATTCGGSIFVVKRSIGSTGTVRITPSNGLIQTTSGTFAANTTLTALGTAGQCLWFISDGINYHRIGN